MVWINRWKGFILGILGIAVIAACFFGLLYLEHIILELYITPPDGFDLPQWLGDYDTVEIQWVNLGSATLALIWVIATSFIDSGLAGDRRLGWLLLYLLAFVFAAYAAFFLLPESKAGGTLALFFALVNGVVWFWLMTAFTSPQTHKFAPVMSSYFRRGW